MFLVQSPPKSTFNLESESGQKLLYLRSDLFFPLSSEKGKASYATVNGKDDSLLQPFLVSLRLDHPRPQSLLLDDFHWKLVEKKTLGTRLRLDE